RAEVELDRPGVLARLQHDGVPAELERTELEAGAGAQRGVEEHQRDGLALQRFADRRALEAGGGGQQRVQLGAGEVLGIEEMLHWRDSGLGKAKSPALGRAFIGGAVARPGYPAGMWASRRRAREVMPAAMRALVRTGALALGWFIAAHPRTRGGRGQAPVIPRRAGPRRARGSPAP